MSLELAYENREQDVVASPATDKAIELALKSIPNMTMVDCVPILSGLKMVGVGFAEVQARYDANRVEDGAMDILRKKYLDKAILHIPEQIHAELTDDDFDEILEEQADLARNEAEMNVILAPDIDIISAETINPTVESLQAQQIKILEGIVEAQKQDIHQRDETIRRHERTIAGLRMRLGEDDPDAIATDSTLESKSAPDENVIITQGAVGKMTLRAADVAIR